MRILVTGGAGFIGTHLVELLAAEGHQVRVLDALHPDVHRVPPRLPEGVELRVGDVRDAAAVAAALDGIEAVSHQAAMVGLGVDLDDLPSYAGHNDFGTAVVLAEMHRAGVPRLALASSMVVYGEGAYTCPEHGPVRPAPRHVKDLERGRFEPGCPRCGRPLTPALVAEDARLDPRNAYAASKLAQEHLATVWARESGGVAVALRYHNVYGPGMPRNTPYAGVAALFRSALERGEPPRVFEDGHQRRDFIHVRDVAAAGLAALRVEREAGSFTALNTGTGQPHTVGEMAAALADAFGGPAPLVTGEYRLGDVRHVTASSERAADVLGWRARVPFMDGMRELASAPLRA